MMMVTKTEFSRVDWESEVETQRLLAILFDIQSSNFDDGTTQGYVAPAFDLESEWDLAGSSTTMGTGIDVF